MDDIVERLRKCPWDEDIKEAADEIERLRAWNAEIALNARTFAEALEWYPSEANWLNPERARAALGKEEA